MRASPAVAFGLVAGLGLAALTIPSSPNDVTADAGSDGPDPDSGSMDSSTSDGSTFDSGGPDATTCNQTMSQVCAEAGANGCAGFGGEGGVGGQGGGAAIALYVIGDSHVTVENGAFFVARGGQGGAGGDGGQGSTGHNGANGASVQCYGSCDQTCKPVGGYMLDGGAGGTGANGGAGGLGGGGAGGPIYFYAYIDAAAPVVSPSTLTASKVIDGGGPGEGGSPNGKTGAQGIQFP